MEALRRLGVSGRRFFGCVEAAKVDVLATSLDFGAPSAGLFVEVDSLESGMVIPLWTFVAKILRRRCPSQIKQMVLTRAAVLVVKILRRPLAVDVQPNYAMTKIQAVIDSNLPCASGTASRSSDLPHKARVPRSGPIGPMTPSQFSGSRSQIKDFANELSRQIRKVATTRDRVHGGYHISMAPLTQVLIGVR
jgi:hypothetical protein